jgi:chromosomal replication initiation ATPase DnaA
LTRQLAFDLPVREARGREDFFVSPSNALALAALDTWRDWPGLKMILTGRAGSGKTHLAQVWALATSAQVVEGADLLTQDLPALAAGAVVVENAQGVAALPELQTALFHLHNLAAEARMPLLLTAERPPRDWGLTLPDLASRMQAAQIARIESPDDALLTAVLLKQFQDRQLAVSPSIITYLAREMDRSLSLARRVVGALDARALAERSPVTRAMVVETLQMLAQTDEGAS